MFPLQLLGEKLSNYLSYKLQGKIFAFLTYKQAFGTNILLITRAQNMTWSFVKYKPTSQPMYNRRKHRGSECVIKNCFNFLQFSSRLSKKNFVIRQANVLCITVRLVMIIQSKSNLFHRDVHCFHVLLFGSIYLW